MPSAQPLVACPYCDALQRIPQLPPRTRARCLRCHAGLYRPYTENLDRPLAYSLAAAILFLIANFFPIVGLQVQDQHTTATLFGTARALYEENMQLLAGLVFFTTILVPAVQLLAMCYLLIPLRLGRVPKHLPFALRMLQTIRPWGMVEVFILGVLVALVKLAHVASVVPGVALWSFGGLMLMIAAAAASFDPRQIWARQGLA